VLLARVTADHVAAVTGDCPHCGGALAFDVGRDAVLCPSGAAAFRLDGSALAGPPGLRLASLPVRRAGPRIEIDLA
jgi:nitrite reductase/ring-hydroxylating ferredoxin subunit